MITHEMRDKLEAARKNPVPDDLRDWVSEVAGISRYIGQLDHSEAITTTLYARSQRDYYICRLTVLLASPPRLPSRARWRRILEAAAK